MHQMNKNSVAFFLCFIFSSTLCAQHNVFSVGGSGSLTILGGTLFSADSLVLTPTGIFTMSSNAVLETPVPTAGSPFGSIDRVYYFNNPIVFTGNIQIYYKVSELNGNIENQLNYADSTIGSWWLVSSTGIVNTTAHYVQYPASSHSLIAATAAQGGEILLINLVSFTGFWDVDHVHLSWAIDENQDSKEFTIESSQNNQAWKAVAVIPGSQMAGEYDYGYNDYNGTFTTREYRIKITENSGDIIYSPIIEISRDLIPNRVYVVSKPHGATIFFPDLQPKGVRIFNAAGQLIWQSNSSQNKYDVNGLFESVYFVQYELNGINGVRKFIVL
jgi:hypothetical protein